MGDPGLLSPHAASVITSRREETLMITPSYSCCCGKNYCGVRPAISPNKWTCMGGPHCDLEKVIIVLEGQCVCRRTSEETIPETHRGHGLDFVVHVCLSGGTMSVCTQYMEREEKEGSSLCIIVHVWFHLFFGFHC